MSPIIGFKRDNAKIQISVLQAAIQRLNSTTNLLLASTNSSKEYRYFQPETKRSGITFNFVICCAGANGRFSRGPSRESRGHQQLEKSEAEQLQPRDGPGERAAERHRITDGIDSGSERRVGFSLAISMRVETGRRTRILRNTCERSSCVRSSAHSSHLEERSWRAQLVTYIHI